MFFSLADARRKLALWLHDYNHHRPHSALADRTPAGFPAGRLQAMEKAAIKPPWKTLRVYHFSIRTAAAGSGLNCAPVSTALLLETIAELH